MKFLRIALAWLALCGAAYAQSQVPAGGVMGNSAAAQRPARAETLTSIIDRALGSTRGAILERGAAVWQIIAPNATAGLPFVSAGTGADPLYQLLGVVGGGTGQNTYAIGDILQASSSTALSRLAAVPTGNALISGGVGTVSSWGKITSAHITGQALTKVDDTNVTATLGGTPASALVNAASITLGWTGTLAVARGGSGTGTQQGLQNAAHNCPPTRAGDLIYYNGTNWICLAGNNTGTRILQEDASGVPSWVAAGAGTVTSIGLTNTYGLSVSGSPVTTSGNISAGVSLTTASNALGGNTSMSSTGTYFDGPSMAQGTTGTWFASGTVTLNDSSASASNFFCKLWDGTTVIASGNALHPATANLRTTITLSGYLASPAANIRISCANQDTTTSVFEFNRTGNSKDSSIYGVRIN